MTKQVATKLKSNSSLAITIPRDYNNQEEVDIAVTQAGLKKTHFSVDKTIYMGFLAGVFVGLSGILATIAASGFPSDFRTLYPSIPKIIFGACFPVGLFLIVLFGGDLFTGNTMIMTVTYLHNRIKAKELIKNWILVFLSNFLGCLFTAFFFGYMAQIFDSNAIEYIQALVQRKVNLAPSTVFFRSIGANLLVCLAIFLGLSARDVTGKIIGMWVPIFAFAVTGFEHCVANMFFFCQGAIYNTDIDWGKLFINFFLVTLGNIIGGGLLVGGSEVYLYHWRVGEKKSDIGFDANVEKHGERTQYEKNMFKAKLEKLLPFLRKSKSNQEVIQINQLSKPLEIQIHSKEGASSNEQNKYQ